MEFETCSDHLEIVDTIPGWAHEIKNVGPENLVVLLWANEVFDKENTMQFHIRFRMMKT